MAAVFAKATWAVCLLASVITVGGELVLASFRPITHLSDYAALLLAVGAYFLLALFAWLCRTDRSASVTVWVLTLCLVVGGHFLMIIMEWYDYYRTVIDHPRGAEYMSVRYQRVAIFFVPALQWLVTVVLGFVFLGRRIRIG